MTGCLNKQALALCTRQALRPNTQAVLPPWPRLRWAHTPPSTPSRKQPLSSRASLLTPYLTGLVTVLYAHSWHLRAPSGTAWVPAR